MTPDPIPHARESAVEVLRPPITAAQAFTDAKLAVGYLYRQGEGALEGYFEARAYQEQERATALATPSGDDVAELRAELEAAHSASAMNLDAALTWAKSAKTSQDRVTTAEAQRDALQERVRVLEEALRPFSSAYDRVKFHAVLQPIAVYFTPYDLKRARAALTPHQQGDGSP